MKLKYSSIMLLLSLLASAQLHAQSAEMPNVILMVADNVGYGDIGAFQGGDIRGMPTPRIDQMVHFRLTPNRARECSFSAYMGSEGCIRCAGSAYGFDEKRTADQNWGTGPLPAAKVIGPEVVHYGIKMPEDVAMTVQDRAYTSAIWYTPSS